MKSQKSATSELISFFRECYSLMKEKDISEFSFEKSGIKISIKRALASHDLPRLLSESIPVKRVLTRPVKAQTPSAAVAEEKVLKTIKSPLAGIFYNAASPNSKPFINPPCNVSKGETLSIVEAMKVMNEIESPSNCRILRILAKNAELVQKSDDLFEIE
ncbi:MAG: hypothetical protein CVU78_05895 [Elusimicrobia bacterium HGW-Elusimicrobia-2]|nr:MAG: hypothetical protein CVU78_05895 [Elusimicrobia bacterium HGW-Elusimicrobia-2]